MKNFKSAIHLFNKKLIENKNIRSLIINPHWSLIYCRKSNHYYAMKMAENECIKSGMSFIRPAYRIDPLTGHPEKIPCQQTSASHQHETNETLRIFAIKEFLGDKSMIRPMAQSETTVLKAMNHFAELDMPPAHSCDNPIIIMDFYPGKTICDANGNPNRALLDELSLKDRLAIALQITNQFYDIHTEKNNKKPYLHVDVKGANILVHIEKNNDNKIVNTNVVDFGSAKELNGNGSIETGILGLTLYTAPPEVLATNQSEFIELNEETGFLNKKSDIYCLGAVFAALLGAYDPYNNRRTQIAVDHQLYDMGKLSQQTSMGFNFDGLLNNKIIPPSFKIRINPVDCAFENLSAIEAPSTQAILCDENLPVLGYVLYKNQFLYINKAKKTVLGREDTKASRQMFSAKVANIRHITSKPALTARELDQCLQIANYHPQDETTIATLIYPLIEIFLLKMVDINHEKRPCSEEVLRFFTVANKITALASCNDTNDRLIQIEIIKLNILIHNGWHINLPTVDEDLKTNENHQIYTFQQFDFSLLEEDENLFNEFCTVFSDPELLQGQKTLSTDSFKFLAITSEEKRILDLILEKIKLACSDNRAYVYDDFINPVKEILCRGLNVANEFLSLSAPIMICLITQKIPDYFATDFRIKKEFYNRQTFIQYQFPTIFKKLKKIVLPYSHLHHMKTLKKHSELEIFIANQNNPKLVNSWLDEYCLQAHSVSAFDVRNKLFHLHHKILANQQLVEDLSSPSTFQCSLKITADRLLKEIMEYKNKMEKEKLAGKRYLKFSFFGVFGHTVDEKITAANLLIETMASGNYQHFLSVLKKNELLMSALSRKTLGTLSKPFLDYLSISEKLLNNSQSYVHNRRN